jgi:urease accessory protein
MPSWLFLQLADSAFPTGGFVHSGGLEAAVQLRLVDQACLESWLAEALEAAAHAALPLVGAAHQQPERILEWDALAEAWLWNPPANRASRAQGQAWLTTTHAAFPTAGLDDLKRQLRAAASPGHQAPILGAILARLGLSLEESRRLALFLHLRALISTAIRLGLMGPLEAQGMQHRLAPALEAAAALAVPCDAMATVAPLSELAHLHHDRLYSRLFAT